MKILGAKMGMSWEIAGKIAAIVSSLWAVIQIYKHFFQEKHSVTYDVIVTDNVLPPLQQRLEAWIDKELPDSLGRKVDADSIPDIADHLKRYATWGFLSKVPKLLVRIELKNSGKKAAKKLVVDLGRQPIEVTFSSPEMKLDGTVLRLEELRPHQSVTASLWFDSYFMSKPKVSHDDHLVEETIATIAKGRAWKLFFIFWPGDFLGWMLSLALLIWIACSIFSAGYTNGVSTHAISVPAANKGQ